MAFASSVLTSVLVTLPPQACGDEALELGRWFVGELCEEPGEWRREEEIAHAVPLVERLYDVLSEDVASRTASPWAGVYEMDLGGPRKLVLSPRGAALVHGGGWLWRHRRVNLGAVTELGPRSVRVDWELSLEQQFPPSIAGFYYPVLHEELYIIPTRKGRIAIPKTAMIPYVNELNASPISSPPLGTSYLLRGRDKGQSTRNLPAAFLPFLRTVEATILAVTVTEKGRRLRVELVADVGSEDGLLPGMTLHVHPPLDVPHDERAFTEAVAVDVQQGHAILRHLAFADRFRAPRVGWRLSTRRDRRAMTIGCALGHEIIREANEGRTGEAVSPSDSVAPGAGRVEER